jgi:hypothetical protein
MSTFYELSLSHLKVSNFFSHFLCLLSSPLRITNTRVGLHYFVQRTAWESYSHSSDQHIPWRLWNLLLLCSVSPPLYSVVSRKMQSIHSSLIPLRFTLIFSHLCIYLTNALAIHDFQRSIAHFLSIGFKYIIPLNLSVIYLIPLLTSDGQLELWSSLWCIFLPCVHADCYAQFFSRSLQFSVIVNMWEI